MPILLVSDEIRSFKFGLINQREFRLTDSEIEIEKETVCLKTKEQLLFEKCMNAIKEKNKEEASKYATELYEIRKRINLFYNTILAIDRVRIRIDSFCCDYVHGSEPRDRVLSKIKVSVTLLRESSQKISSFLPDLSKQLNNECITLEGLLTGEPLG